MPEASSAKWLCVIAFMDLFAVSMVVPLAAAHLRSLGFTHFMTGLLGSVYAAIQLVSGPLLGSWSDVRGRRPIMLLTLTVCSLCYLVTGVATSLPVILAVRVALGFFKQTQTLCKTLVADVLPAPEHPDAYGRINSISSIGFMVGPVLGGHLAELDNGFFYICCLACLSFWAIIGISYMFVPDVSPKTNPQRVSPSLTAEVGCTARRLMEVEWSVYWDVFALKFLLGFSQAAFYSHYSLSLQENFGVSARWVGYSISFQGLLGALGGFLVGWLGTLYRSDTTFSLRTLHGFLLLCVAFCALGSAPTPGTFMASLVPLSVAGSFLRVVGLESVLQRTPLDKRGSVVGASNSVSSVARLVSPLFSGAVHDAAGFTGVSLVCVVSAGFGAVLAAALRLAERRKAKVS